MTEDIELTEADRSAWVERAKRLAFLIDGAKQEMRLLQKKIWAYDTLLKAQNEDELTVRNFESTKE